MHTDLILKLKKAHSVKRHTYGPQFRPFSALGRSVVTSHVENSLGVPEKTELEQEPDLQAFSDLYLKYHQLEKAVACLHTLQLPFNRQESRRQLKVYKTVYRVTTEYDIENNEIRPFLEMRGLRDDHTNYGSHSGKNI